MTLVNPDLVKGASDLGYTESLATLVDDAEQSLKAARAETAKSVAPELQSMIAGAGAQAAMQSQIADMQKMLADITKTEITSGYPISGSATTYGLAVYDLQAPSLF